MKTFIGSLIAFLVGTSCCWLSSLALWVGGAALVGTIINFAASLQTVAIGLGTVLFVVTIFLYSKHKDKK